MGPSLVTADEIPDPQDLDIRCSVGDRVVQSSNTSQMYFGVAAIISYCSRSFSLEPGDVIATGTPGGVGIFREPPLLLADGDEVTVEIERVGRLRNRCRTEPAAVASA
jgi:2-keto-4-pentenoate hydratase/2-oxohepta-3-ene-1,7-dioic acid hydratase in catechol pathway